MVLGVEVLPRGDVSNGNNPSFGISLAVEVSHGGTTSWETEPLHQVNGYVVLSLTSHFQLVSESAFASSEGRPAGMFRAPDRDMRLLGRNRQRKEKRAAEVGAEP